MEELIEATTDDALSHAKAMDFVRRRRFLFGDYNAFFVVQYFVGSVQGFNHQQTFIVPNSAAPSGWNIRAG